MDSNAIAAVLLRMARDDTMDDVGRLLISDVQREIGDPKLTVASIMNAWKEHYPKYEITQRTDNIILVFWSGQNATRNIRSLRAPSRTE